MPIPVVLFYAAAYCSLALIVGVLLRDRHSFVHRAFAAGMFLLVAEDLLRAASLRSVLPEDVVYWQRLALSVSTLIPPVWLAFSAGYGRSKSSGAFPPWTWGILAVSVAPIPLVIFNQAALFSGLVQLEEAARWSIALDWLGRALQYFSICSSVLIVFNMERAVRSSTGRIRWQIKFMALGVGGLFAMRIYVATQALLFSSIDTGLGTVAGMALIAADLLFALSLFRGSGALNVDVYLSTATIQNSLTVVLAGVYLLSVGVLAQLARYVSPTSTLPLDASIVFVALTILAILLLSDRLRRRIRIFVTRHFSRPLYDYRSVWMELTQRTSSLVDAGELSVAVSRMVSESLETLSVSVWLVDEARSRLILSGSTALSGSGAREFERAGKNAVELIRHLQDDPACIDLRDHDFTWPKEVMNQGQGYFREFPMRYVIGLHCAGELVGVMTLNDDIVGREGLSTEDILLLEALAAQLAASLLNVRLSARLRHAKEVETFQTVSTFFVHDLKNLASRLSLTMQNLPANFDNPEFRADALRVISTSLTKIDDMCDRLAMLKQNVELKLSTCDLNDLVSRTLSEFESTLKAVLQQDLKPLPKTQIDVEQIHKVLTNLVLNASESVNGDGVVRVGTSHEGDTLSLSVRDNGCGMSEDFIEHSLFRPFKTTKKKGLGIGLFHTKLIVEAHSGRIEVNSAVGVGTEFRVILPVR